jgi:hypothetical protein
MIVLSCIVIALPCLVVTYRVIILPWSLSVSCANQPQDQAAFNLVNFEKKWRGLMDFQLHVLNPHLFVKSPIFNSLVKSSEIFLVPNERFASNVYF